MRVELTALLVLAFACSGKGGDSSVQDTTAGGGEGGGEGSGDDSGSEGDGADDTGGGDDTGGADDTGEGEPTFRPTTCDDPADWAAGPYEAAYQGVADDFTVQTTDGEWNLVENWTGCDSYIFEFYYSGSDYSKALWRTDVSDIIGLSPENVHYFFASYTADDEERLAEIEVIQDDLEEELARLDADEAAQWRGRFHFLTDSGWELGWPSEMSAFHFGIDRFQRIRDPGLLYSWRAGRYKLEFLAYEPQGYNYEHELAAALDAVAPYVASEVTVFDAEEVGSGWSSGPVYTSVDIPDLSDVDTLLFDFTMDCEDSDGDGIGDCPEWDRQADGYLCEPDDASDCTKSFGRWITSYYRPGHWLTDATELLPLLGAGGETRDIGWYSVDTWKITWKLLFAKTGWTASRPAEVVEMWSGGSLDADYSDAQEDITFDVPSDASRVVFVTVLTGHGSGTDTLNCAEFCNSEHHFTVNDKVTYTKDNPDAGTWSGCMDRVADGVSPNQYGSWPFGRAGWCPGLDVPPWSVDITDDVTLGAENTMSYSATVDGDTYVPSYTGGGDYYPTIEMRSWVMIWR